MNDEFITHNFTVRQDEHKLWHWLAVNEDKKVLYESANSYLNKDDAIMVGQSYGHTYIGEIFA